MEGLLKCVIPIILIFPHFDFVIKAEIRHQDYTVKDVCDITVYGEVFLSVTVTKSSRCALQCSLTGKCTSFLFDPDTRNCRLNIFRNPSPYMNNTCRPIKYWEADYSKGYVLGCTDAKENIRLCDGDGPDLVNATMGRIEVFWDGRWGSVCDDYWNDFHYTDDWQLYGDENARVVCRTFGYSSGISRPNNYFTKQVWPFPQLFDNVKCTGTEQHLFDCPMHFGENCQHSEDVGVECFL